MLFSWSISNAAELTFDDAISGEVKYFFDSDNDGIADVILSTTDPAGYNTNGPGDYMSFISEPGLEGTTSLNPDLQVDFLRPVQGSLKFGFALCDSDTSDTWASFKVYSSGGNLLTSEFANGEYTFPDGSNPSNFPEGYIEAFFSGDASYALFDFNTTPGCERYIIDNFRFDHSIQQIEIIDFNIEEDANELSHSTNKYDPVVFRRAGILNFSVTVTDGFDKARNYLTLKIRGPNGTQIANLGNKNNSTSWNVQIGNPNGFCLYDDCNLVNMKVYVPYDIPIGKYTFTAQLSENNGVGTPTEQTASDPAYIIFNPWSPLDDDVYRASLSKNILDEYILNETGIIYLGNQAKKWNYNQFDTEVFETVMEKIEQLNVSERSNAWSVAKHLAATANHYDDDGILVGKWGGVYFPYHQPNYWSETKTIFNAYNGGTLVSSPGPVKYGQCWVFAGILNSMSRTVGIPTRVVTTIDSAVDTFPYDGTINRFIRTDREKLTLEDKKAIYDSGYGYPDMIWNWHVWNEGWFNRPDRNTFTGVGWQAFDGTAQDHLLGNFREAGPAPLSAIKADTGGSYDVDFFNHAIQADAKVWLYNPDTGEVKDYGPTGSGEHKSKHIWTMDPDDSKERIDLLNDYCSSDCPNLSSSINPAIEFHSILAEYFDSFLKFFIGTVHAAPIPGSHLIDIVPSSDIKLGSVVEGSVIVNNTGTANDVVDVLVHFKITSSNGETITLLDSESFLNIPISAGESLEIPFETSIPIINSILPETDYLSITVIVDGAEGNGIFQKNTVIHGHSVELTTPGLYGTDQSTVSAKLTNPLSLKLENVVLTLIVPTEVKILTPNPITIGEVQAGGEVIIDWGLSVPVGNYTINSEVKTANMAAIYSSTTIRNAGPANIKLSLQTPDDLIVGDIKDLTVNVYNTGGDTTDVLVNVSAAEGLGSVDETFEINDLIGGTSESYLIPLQGIIPGSFSVVALANSPEGDSTSQASSVVAVIGQKVQLNMNIEPDTVYSSQPSDCVLRLESDSASDVSVNLSSIASDAEKRFAIFDGSSRVLSQVVNVPPQGKNLSLTVDQSNNGGWIKVSAIPVNDPTGVTSAELVILGEVSQTVVNDLVSVDYSGLRYDRRTREFYLTATLTNTSSSVLEGPVWLSITNLQPTEATLNNSDGFQDGKPYLAVLQEGEIWQPGQVLAPETLFFSNPTRVRISFFEQILAVLPN